MVIILDDVVNLDSSFQSDIIEVFQTYKNHTGKTNFNEKWYSLDEDHIFRDVCLQMMVKAHHYVDLTSCIGYEFWTQNNTRPNGGWHQDKDEQLRIRTGKINFPLCSLIYYPLVKNLEGGQLHVEDDIIVPKTNRLVIISAGMWHSVREFTGNRISFLINPWNKILNNLT
tara:strand:- start:605 stop:1114 length:510 start_codon:yes stop_codon:yes gene_type:complete